MQITHILETHLHADFVSGHLDLAEETGAKICVPTSGQCEFDHIGLADRDTFEIEDLVLRVLETPGHTPEHICYAVVDSARGGDPAAVFSGDTLFVGDVGRPDLFPGKASDLASSLYDSLHQILLRLPDFCEVYPAHGAGSLCGRAMGAKRTSTIGYERKYNPALQIRNREAFVESLTTDMPPAPDHFHRCSEVNRRGPALHRDLPTMRTLDPRSFDELSRLEDTLVLDVREYGAFSGNHIPGSYNNDMHGNFATFAGWVLPDVEILLVADNGDQAAEAAVQLRRVGLDQVIAHLKGGVHAWASAGLTIDHVKQLSFEELHRMSTGTRDMVLIDVRSQSEFEAFHIGGALNIPVADLRTRYRELEPDAPTVLICGVGIRSSLGSSILKQHGFKRLFGVPGGMKGYSAAGYAPECPMCYAPHVSRFLGRRIGLEMMTEII
jgi:glyoxylase-like metal-dependent hydrolase (beta-lactamase superfamily II)/rhodanese-related sulfurtransferase